MLIFKLCLKLQKMWSVVRTSFGVTVIDASLDTGCVMETKIALMVQMKILKSAWTQLAVRISLLARLVEKYISSSTSVASRIIWTPIHSISPLTSLVHNHISCSQPSLISQTPKIPSQFAMSVHSFLISKIYMHLQARSACPFAHSVIYSTISSATHCVMYINHQYSLILQKHIVPDCYKWLTPMHISSSLLATISPASPLCWL